jgi:hypothetical protein
MAQEQGRPQCNARDPHDQRHTRAQGRKGPYSQRGGGRHRSGRRHKSRQRCRARHIGRDRRWAGQDRRVRRSRNRWRRLGWSGCISWKQNRWYRAGRDRRVGQRCNHRRRRWAGRSRRVSWRRRGRRRHLGIGRSRHRCVLRFGSSPSTLCRYRSARGHCLPVGVLPRRSPHMGPQGQQQDPYCPQSNKERLPTQWDFSISGP